MAEWRVKRAGDADVQACMAIARELPEYFTEDGLAAMDRDLRRDWLYVARAADGAAEGAGAPEGFVAVRREGPRVAELTWMAVRRGQQRQGMGTALLERAAADLAAAGVALLKAKTLGPEISYEPYARTRLFYEALGFIHLETVWPYPGWDADTPCAIYVRILG